MLLIMYRSPYSTPSAPQRELAPQPYQNPPAVRRRRRALLLVLSGLLLAAPIALFEPGAYWSDDPELFRLLRGMAVLKGLMAIVAFSAVWWRFGRAMTRPLAMVGLISVSAMALASGLIWELTLVPAASALFHAATIALLLAAWREVKPRLS